MGPDHRWQGPMLCLHSGEGMCQMERECKGMTGNNSFLSYGADELTEVGTFLQVVTLLQAQAGASGTNKRQ